jgi:hypothetical protein
MGSIKEQAQPLALSAALKTKTKSCARDSGALNYFRSIMTMGLS